MPFRHGVYTSEVATSLQTAPAVDSALPYVVGASVSAFGPVVVTSWRQFVELSGITEGTHDVPGEDGWHSHSLVSFAYLWFRLCGRGDCIMCGIASADGTLSQADIISAIGKIDTVYERVRRLPSLIVVPYFGNVATIWTAMKAKADLYGGRFRAVAVGDIASNAHALSGQTASVVSDPADVAEAKTVLSESLALFWPYIGIGGMRFDMSSAACAVMNRVDAQNGNLPFVSPSNKNCYATGVYTMPEATLSDSVAGCTVDELGCVLNSSGDPLTAHDDDETAELSSPDNPDAVFSRNSGNLAYSHEFTGTAGSIYTEQFTLTGVTGSGTVHVVGTVTATTGGGPRTETFGQDFNYVNGKFTIRPSGSYAVWIGWDSFVITDARAAWHVSDRSDVTVSPFSVSIDFTGRREEPLFQSRDEVNMYLGANGVIGALNTADGWVLWGNNTTCFPGNTDVKDNMLAIRRMFNYTQNLFQVFAQPRIDNPLNRRQLEGVVNSFNQILASLQGFGALNSASVQIDDERNTTEQLIRGVVYFRIRIAPPPPMQEINGVFEFDVQGFEASLA